MTSLEHEAGEWRYWSFQEGVFWVVVLTAFYHAVSFALVQLGQ